MSLASSYPCPACGASRRERFSLYYDGAQKLYRCGECGLIAEFPGPGASTTVLEYEDRTASTPEGKDAWLYPGRERALADIAERLRRAGGSGRLLDIGCGDGHFLTVCSGRGFEVSGIEPSRAFAERCRSRGLDVVSGYYEESSFEPESFDVITLIQVLEHVPHPRPMLAAAHSHLKPGGMLCIEVPSSTAPHFLLYRATRIRAFVDPPRGVIRSHVAYYDPRSVRSLTAASGFSELALVTGRWAVKYDGWKHWVGKALDPLSKRFGVGGILYLGRRPGPRSK